MIVVHGATGFTGGLVCDQLDEQGVSFVVAGRNPGKLQALSERLSAAPAVRVVANLDPADLDDAFENADVVINCAGPFMDLGRPVVDAAIRNAAHYLDTTGEQPFIRECAGLHDAASAANVVLSPGCAFEYATGDCAAAILAGHGVREMVVFYGTTGAATSRGTKKSIVRMLGRRGHGLQDGKLVERASGQEVYEVEIAGRTRAALWFAGGEPVMVPVHHPEVQTVHSALVVSGSVARALRVASPVLPVVARTLRPILDRAIEHTSADPHSDSDKTPRFVVKAVDLHHDRSWVALHGTEPYVLTARIIAKAAVRLQNEGAAVSGFAPVASCFDPVEFIESVDVRVEDAVVHG